MPIDLSITKEKGVTTVNVETKLSPKDAGPLLGVSPVMPVREKISVTAHKRSGYRAMHIDDVRVLIDAGEQGRYELDVKTDKNGETSTTLTGEGAIYDKTAAAETQPGGQEALAEMSNAMGAALIKAVPRAKKKVARVHKP